MNTRKKEAINQLTDTINQALDEIRQKEIGRAVIMIQPIENEATGGWKNTEKKAYYHPHTLSQTERKEIDANGNYQVMSLINGYEPRILQQLPGNYVWQQPTNTEPKIEFVNRSKVYTSSIDSFENNNFENEWETITAQDQQQIEEIATYLLSINIDSQEFKKLFEKGVAEYHQRTIQLMDKVGATQSSATIATNVEPRPNIIDTTQF